jgi:hypothetical protein
MPTPHSAYGAGSELALAPAGTLIRKTSLQDRTDNPLRSSKRLTKHSRDDPLAENDTIMPGARTGRGLVYAFMGKPMSSYDHDRYSERPSLHDVRYHAFVACLTGKPMSPSCNQKRICFPSDETLNPDWWSQTGSNRRPPACKAGALPAELWPLKSIRPEPCL